MVASGTRWPLVVVLETVPLDQDAGFWRPASSSRSRNSSPQPAACCEPVAAATESVSGCEPDAVMDVEVEYGYLDLAVSKNKCQRASTNLRDAAAPCDESVAK